MKHWFRQHKTYLGMLVAVIAFYAVLIAVGATCPIKYVTGISCPGCGMSRAMGALLRLDFSAAAYYHPLSFAMPPVAVGMLFTHATRRHRAFSALLYGTAGALVAVYLYRLLLLEQGVVVAAPQNGLIARALRSIFHSP
jgi:hypothetical protein